MVNDLRFVDSDLLPPDMRGEDGEDDPADRRRGDGIHRQTDTDLGDSDRAALFGAYSHDPAWLHGRR